MEQDLITIIVPVYRTEEYLDKCIISIINQTYKNLEIILIDDGSDDNCPRICDKYSVEDKRIKVIHQKNGGVSSARNKGIETANGKYLMFVDSDDYLEENMIEIIYNKAKINDTDLFLFNYCIVENQKKEKNSTFKIPNKKLNKKNFYNYLFSNKYYGGYICNKLFKKEVIKNVKFEENIYLLEDLLFTMKVAENCHNFYYDNEIYPYNYVKRSGSALNSDFNIKHISSITVRNTALKYAKKYHAKSIKVLKFNLLWDSIYYKYKLKKENIELNMEIDYKKYRTFLLSALTCNEYTISKRLRLLIIYIFPNTYFNIKEKLKK